MIRHLHHTLALLLAAGLAPACTLDDTGSVADDDPAAPRAGVDDVGAPETPAEPGIAATGDYVPASPALPQPYAVDAVGSATNPTGLAIAPNGVYWTDASTSDAETSRVVSSGASIAAYYGSPVGLITLGDQLYWADTDRGNILRTSVTGGQIYAVVSGLPAPYAVATDGERLYWSDVEHGSIWSLHLTTRSVSIVAQDQGVPARIVVSGGTLIWSDVQSGSIRALSDHGGAVTTLVTGRALSTGLAVDGGYVYFCDLLASTVERVSLANGSIEILAEQQVGAWTVAVDDTTLMWGGREDSAIVAMPKDGGVMEVVAQGQQYPDYLVAAGGAFYWANTHEGTIWRAAR